MNDFIQAHAKDELYHHGIVNMHWGDKHGPPYPLDKQVSRAIQKGTGGLKKMHKAIKMQNDNHRRRKAAQAEKAAKEASQRAAEKAAKKETKGNKELAEIRKMSDAELRQRLDRIKLEREYINLVQQTRRSAKGNTPSGYIKKLASNSLDRTANTVVPAMTTYAAKQLIKKYAGLTDAQYKEIFGKNKKNN